MSTTGNAYPPSPATAFIPNFQRGAPAFQMILDSSLGTWRGLSSSDLDSVVISGLSISGIGIALQITGLQNIGTSGVLYSSGISGLLSSSNTTSNIILNQHNA